MEGTIRKRVSRTSDGGVLPRVYRKYAEGPTHSNPNNKALIGMVEAARNAGGPFSDEEVEAKLASVTIHPMVTGVIRRILRSIGRE